jgi:hypothetical protein
MSESSASTKHGQEASTKRARAALDDQDARRARRPLEGTRSAEQDAAPTDQRVTNESKLDLQTAGEALVEKDKTPDIAALLKRYGITTVPNAVYEWGGYRYSNPTDAIAAAKRGNSA